MILGSQGVSKAHIPMLQCCTRLMNCINKVMFAIYEMFFDNYVSVNLNLFWNCFCVNNM